MRLAIVESTEGNEEVILVGGFPGNLDRKGIVL